MKLARNSRNGNFTHALTAEIRIPEWAEEKARKIAREKGCDFPAGSRLGHVKLAGACEAGRK